MELESNVVDIQHQNHQKHHHRQQLFHVLAVDDSLIDRKLLEKLLKVSSYQVTCVDSGDKALEYLGLLDGLNSKDNSNASPSSNSESSKQEELRVNMIMTDFCMPGMTGYDLLKRVKGSSWKDVPVVVMSSENVPSRINMCLEGGAEEFLLKPVQLSDLEKLQPCILKSCGRSCNNMDNDFDNHKEIDINNTTTNLPCKRKAMSPEPAERRLKMKGLAAVPQLVNT